VPLLLVLLDATLAPPAPDECTLGEPAEPAPPVVVRVSGSVPIAPHATTAAIEPRMPTRAVRSGFFSCEACENVKTTPIMLRYLEPGAIRQGLG
jgi:hypothetical protein